MAQEEQEEILQQYIERVIALRSERGRALDLHDMKNIARELGMGEDDIAAADNAARAHLERGMRHIGYGRWDDAIAELRDAIAMAPASVDALHGLAVAHKNRWQARGSESDRVQAEHYSRRCLAIDPGHDISYELLNELDRPPRGRTARTTRKRRSNVGIVIAICLALVIIVQVWSIVGGSDGGGEVDDVVIEDTREVAVENGTGSGPASYNGASASTDPQDHGLMALREGTPVRLIWECEKVNGANIEVYSRRSDGGAYLLIHNVGSIPIRTLTLRVGAEGPVYSVIDAGDTPLDPGSVEGDENHISADVSTLSVTEIK